MKHDDAMNTMTNPSKNDSTETILEQRRVESQQQPDSESRSLQIGQDLRRVKLLQPRHNFDFHEDDALDDKVNPLTRNQPLPVSDVDPFFALALDPARFEFEAERTLVNLLAKTRSKFSMDGDTTRNCIRDNTFVGRCQQWIILKKHDGSFVSVVSSCPS
jgi:hypothetical protein